MNIMRERPQAPAFSLVEVVMAMGIASFGLVALTSLLFVSLQSNKTSKDETLFVSMAGNIMSDLKLQAFDDLAGVSGSLAPLYFDSEGGRVGSSGEAAYVCTVSLRPDTATAEQTTAGADGRVHLLLVHLRFAGIEGGYTRQIHATLPRHD